ncbi:MAG TPA: hypothetical protein VIY47_10570, partial [Ignavibacteriaceae bacterium]
MFIFKKQKKEFLFYEQESLVLVYEKVANKIHKIFEFTFESLADSLEKLKKSHPGLSNAICYWILDGRLESIEKTPLNKEEMLNYAKWKIQEMVDVPMHDISFDILTNNFAEANFFKKFA